MNVPISYLETLQGKAAHLFLFSNGKRYAVKCKNNFHGTRELVNEYVVGKLGQLLNLPIVPFEIVNMSEKEIQQIPKKFSSQYQPGSQFASLFIENCTGLAKKPPHPTINEINNPDVLAGILVFDYWVHGSDRTKSNILLKRQPDGKIDIFMIDHGKCFPGGYKWNKEKLQKSKKFKKDSVVHIWTVDILNDLNIASYIEKIQALKEDSIVEVIQNIPVDWNVTHEEKEALFNYLKERKKTLADSVYTFIKKYSDE
ncbi:HipA family kinase [Bacillus sp. AFS055030]|uniref:HipA family kinase n=1 Tax=Bacillus sp. AFS055030 TaxID=2033507 RepID=UPI000BFDD0B7|nr:HipA family kinase [Bacillus sp. AFS055030]PGL70121.1 hypothetical protein CN925_13090 [Bacillus sp. AFS055030]